MVEHLSLFLTAITIKKYVDNYPPPLEFIPQCFMTRQMCDNAVNGCFFVFDSIPN